MNLNVFGIVFNLYDHKHLHAFNNKTKSQLKDLLQWTQHETVLTEGEIITLLSSHSDSENITYTGVEVWCIQTQGGVRQKPNEPAPRLEKQKGS